MKRASVILPALCLLLLSAMTRAQDALTAQPQQLTPWQQKLSQEPIQLTYFGMHIHHASDSTPWPSVPFGTFRLWDAYVSWREIEPSKGNWDFSKLDALVARAGQHNVEVVLPLGSTPPWASARPNENSIYKPGNAAEPADPKDWEDYVNTVTSRYKGKIAYYEMWNETNLPGFYSGTPEKLVALEKTAYTIMKQNDPNAKMISANVTAPYGVSYFKKLLTLGMANYADIIGYHFYVSPAPPEQITTLASALESAMAAAGVNKPLWNTEAGWHPPANFPNENSQAGILVRAMLIARGAGASRFLWYAWDNRGWVSLFMTESDSRTPTHAAEAYANLEKWLVGNRLDPCGPSATNGVWSCKLHYANGQDADIAWSLYGLATVTFASDNVNVEDMFGKTTTVTSKSFTFGAYPVLIHAPAVNVTVSNGFAPKPN